MLSNFSNRDLPRVCVGCYHYYLFASIVLSTLIFMHFFPSRCRSCSQFFICTLCNYSLWNLQFVLFIRSFFQARSLSILKLAGISLGFYLRVYVQHFVYHYKFIFWTESVRKKHLSRWSHTIRFHLVNAYTLRRHIVIVIFILFFICLRWWRFLVIIEHIQLSTPLREYIFWSRR